MDFCTILTLAMVDVGNVVKRAKIWKVLLLEVFLLVGFLIELCLYIWFFFYTYFVLLYIKDTVAGQYEKNTKIWISKSQLFCWPNNYNYIFYCGLLCPQKCWFGIRVFWSFDLLVNPNLLKIVDTSKKSQCIHQIFTLNNFFCCCWLATWGWVNGRMTQL